MTLLRLQIDGEVASFTAGIASLLELQSNLAGHLATLLSVAAAEKAM